MEYARTYSEIPFGCIFLVQRLMLNRIGDDVFQHDIGNWEELLLGVGCVMFEIGCLQREYKSGMFQRRKKKHGIPIPRDPNSTAQATVL
jgi:hypothetical protein